jgi:enoyl-CoA hydratase/carnithine racemase
MNLPNFDTLRYAIEDGGATITLHRPEKLNAFTARMRRRG